jgi:hypothetical protein
MERCGSGNEEPAAYTEARTRSFDEGTAIPRPEVFASVKFIVKRHFY